MRPLNHLNARRHGAYRFRHRLHAPMNTAQRHFRHHILDHRYPPVAPCRAGASCRGTGRPRLRHSAATNTERAACSRLGSVEFRKGPRRQAPQFALTGHASGGCCRWRSRTLVYPEPQLTELNPHLLAHVDEIPQMPQQGNSSFRADINDQVQLEANAWQCQKQILLRRELVDSSLGERKFRSDMSTVPPR